MKHINPATQYKILIRMEVTHSDDNSILIKCFDELIKSVKNFQKHIVPNSENFRKKVIQLFSRFNNFIHLQSSVDFEKDLKVAKSLSNI